MAKSDVKFRCGCGFITGNPLEAALHSDSEGHTLDALGRIQPDTKPKMLETNYQRIRRTSYAEEK